jgi:hypothetical protein
MSELNLWRLGIGLLGGRWLVGAALASIALGYAVAVYVAAAGVSALSSAALVVSMASMFVCYALLASALSICIVHTPAMRATRHGNKASAHRSHFCNRSYRVTGRRDPTRLEPQTRQSERL